MLEGAPNPFLIVLCSDFPPAEHKRDKEAKWNGGGGEKLTHRVCGVWRNAPVFQTNEQKYVTYRKSVYLKIKEGVKNVFCFTLS